MKALVLERAGLLSLRDFPIEESLGPGDVRIAVHTVGICGSDIHYYERGSIGPFVVRKPMILGHEASGTVIEKGSAVQGLRIGQRVCMEPGVPLAESRATRMGMYNLDPGVRFWATPPVHGCLRESVVHPAAFTFALPDNVTFAEGAMVEPLSVGMHAATKAALAPGDTAVVTGAGTIGIVTALAALAGGCGRVIITDVVQEKLDIAAGLGPITPVNVARQNVREAVLDLTEGWGADVVFEASGNGRVYSTIFDLIRPGGRIVLIGMPGEPVAFDVVAAQAREARIETVFRYAHVYPRAVSLLQNGRIDVTPLITDRYDFDQSVEAFEYARKMRPTSVKVQIRLSGDGD